MGTIEQNLARWPNFGGLLTGYLGRLRKFPQSEVEKTWLYRASRSALERPELTALFDALESAAARCNDNAKRPLQKKFADVLPRRPWKVALPDSNGLLDLLVELAAYAWLCGEYPGGHAEYVPRATGRTPDLQVRLDDQTIGVECMDIHWLRGVSQGFVQQLKDRLSKAQAQLQGYQHKVIFLNYTPSWGLQVDEDVQEAELEALVQSLAPTDSLLVVFRNYGWTKPRWRFNPPDSS